MYVHGLFLLEECLCQPLRGHVPLAPIAWCVHQRTHEGRGGRGEEDGGEEGRNKEGDRGGCGEEEGRQDGVAGVRRKKDGGRTKNGVEVLGMTEEVKERRSSLVRFFLPFLI